jgi:hypothetical protein
MLLIAPPSAAGIPEHHDIGNEQHGERAERHGSSSVRRVRPNVGHVPDHVLADAVAVALPVVDHVNTDGAVHLPHNAGALLPGCAWTAGHHRPRGRAAGAFAARPGGQPAGQGRNVLAGAAGVQMPMVPEMLLDCLDGAPSCRANAGQPRARRTVG